MGPRQTGGRGGPIETILAGCVRDDRWGMARSSRACSEKMSARLSAAGRAHELTAYRRAVLHCRYVALRRLAVAAILAICIGAPIVEIFDQWDHTFQDGNDTEANVVIAALCIGVAVAIGTAVVIARIRALASNSRLYAKALHVVPYAATCLASPLPASSPPTPLRL
jgi:hypothetical protein